jgi:hypothetical protein
LTPFIRSVLQLREKCGGASARRRVLKSRAPRRCTLVLRRCCVPAPRPLRIIRVAMCQTSKCSASIVYSFTTKHSLAFFKVIALDKRPVF